MTRRSSRVAAFAAAFVASSTSMAEAEHASVTLGYSRAKTATTCPDEATFRGLVAARLGYDPFTGTGTRELAVDFERRGNEVTGRLKLSGENDQERRERAFRADAADCFELATSMALVVAVAVDPDAMQARTPSPAPAPPPKGPPPPPKAEPPPPPPVSAKAPAPAEGVEDSARSGRSVRLELGVLLPVGIVPAPRGGLRAGAGLDFGVWSIGVEGAFLFPSSRDNPAGDGEVSAYVLDGSLVPCVQPFDAEAWVLDLCAVGTLGALRSTAEDVTRAEPATDLFATVGPRAAFVLMLSRVIGLGVSAEAPVTLSRVHLYIDDRGERQEVWVQSPVGFIGAVSLVARLK